MLTDNGKERKGTFAAGGERLRVRVTRTKPPRLFQGVVVA